MYAIIDKENNKVIRRYYDRLHTVNDNEYWIEVSSLEFGKSYKYDKENEKFIEISKEEYYGINISN